MALTRRTQSGAYGIPNAYWHPGRGLPRERPQSWSKRRGEGSVSTFLKDPARAVSFVAERYVLFSLNQAHITHVHDTGERHWFIDSSSQAESPEPHCVAGKVNFRPERSDA